MKLIDILIALEDGKAKVGECLDGDDTKVEILAENKIRVQMPNGSIGIWERKLPDSLIPKEFQHLLYDLASLFLVCSLVDLEKLVKFGTWTLFT
jgi:hypothetical protein